jgi:hypothetical protein
MRLPDATLSIFSCSNTLRFIAKRRVNRLPALLRLCAVPSVCPLVAPRFGNVTEKAFSLSGEHCATRPTVPKHTCPRSLGAVVARSKQMSKRSGAPHSSQVEELDREPLVVGSGFRFDKNRADRLETSGVARLQCYRSNDLRWVAEFVRNGLGCAVVRVRQR